ncbi:serine hydrolase domain-containing protein [Maribacter sp. HTCC2170]|uniref:serine hydrolase domain-containing protein n=1 Tax=Maribacter sp. (strain HTCC2170 / KCCM 42371) TaxID=313603 RepID=UPI00006BB124|nr:serine hydrolase domain-containing protein [Maribacter sp. HTCC2170]EAQ99620.1 penicillin-binding protein 4 [Maribacter sp. HTCC2170]
MKTTKRILKYLAITLFAIALWIVTVVSSTMNGWWRESITNESDIKSFIHAVNDEVKNQFVGNFAMATINNGKVEAEIFHTAGTVVDRNTVFQVASLSKWVSAVGVMKLVENGKLDLDVPVSTYLTRWQLPESKYNNDKVTVRRLLSHTAGLTDGLGYSGFESEESIQELEASLTNAADADKGVSGVVEVGVEPGEFKYSGGGFTLLQLLVEEVSGESFTSYMKNTIFEPLNMNYSNYKWNEDSGYKLVEFYNDDGSEAKHYRYTSLAATSLYTSISDLELFFQFFMKGKNNEPIGRNVLKPETLKSMREVHATSLGMDIWGLGTILYTKTDNGDFIIGHDGKSTPPINTAVRLNPETGDGIIVLETGNSDLATKLASEWVFWKTKKVDVILFAMSEDKMKSIIGRGVISIVILSILMGVIRYRKKYAKRTK